VHVCLVLSRAECVLCQRKREREGGIERERREKREKIKERILGEWRYDHNSTIYKKNNY